MDRDESTSSPHELNQNLPIYLSPLRTKGTGKGGSEREGRGLPAASRLRTGVESAGGRKVVAAERAPADPKDGEGM